MSDAWSICKLRDIADIRVSNVDKKFSPAETPVRLCNYMDVYANDYVTASIDFMTASASKAEIERFGLRAGDIIITKDSETPDDIVIPAVIAESIAGLVCGYHLALIRPRNLEINPVYLAKQLGSSSVVKYFALNASGSTRYGLPIAAIENLEIPLAPKPEQDKIAEILSTVDRAIEQTEALIAKQQRIKTGLMQDLLTRGIDEHGNLRTEQTHRFKDSPLGRIPVEWKTARLEELASQIVDGIHHTPVYTQSRVPFVVISDLTSGAEIDYEGARRISETDHKTFSRRVLPQSGDVLVTKDGTLGVSRIVEPDAPTFSIFVSVALIRPITKLCTPLLIWSFFDSGEFLAQLGSLSAGTGLAHIHLEHFRKFCLRCPAVEEQERIFQVIEEQNLVVAQLQKSLQKLKSQKVALMQDLLTGKRRVTALLNEVEAAV